jgi:hypothetical protein
MSRLSLRNNRLKIKTSGEVWIILMEFREYTSNKIRITEKMSTCNPVCTWNLTSRINLQKSLQTLLASKDLIFPVCNIQSLHNMLDLEAILYGLMHMYCSSPTSVTVWPSSNRDLNTVEKQGILIGAYIKEHTIGNTY